MPESIPLLVMYNLLPLCVGDGVGDDVGLFVVVDNLVGCSVVGTDVGLLVWYVGDNESLVINL